MKGTMMSDSNASPHDPAPPRSGEGSAPSGAPPYPAPPPQPGPGFAHPQPHDQSHLQGQPPQLPPAYAQHHSGQQPTDAWTPPATLWWGIASVTTMLAAVSIPEDDVLGWTAYPAWAVVMVLAALTTMLPVIAVATKIKPELAWRIAAGAAGTLVALWVLFTLPSIQRNTALLATVATVTGVMAVVVAPGRPPSTDQDDNDPQDRW